MSDTTYLNEIIDEKYIEVGKSGKKFNKKELNDRFLFNRKYGIVMPIFKEGLTPTIYKRLLTDDYTKEEIAEKLRVFYVALTRAREKMIIVYPINEEESVNFDFNNGLVNNLERMKYTSFGSVMNSIKEILKPYVNTVEYEVDRNYLLTKKVNYKEKLEKLDFKYITDKISINKKVIDTKNYSHSINKIEKVPQTEVGLDVHEVLEYLDFKNYKDDIDNYDISDYFKKKILKLFECPFMNDILKVYKEYEFYTEDSHGIIDLLIEKENEFVIVDYKLKDIDKDYYIDQVKGYINYLNNITDKKVTGYLYSIIDSTYYHALLQIADTLAFNSLAPAETYVPAFLNEKFPQLSPGSIVNLTYNNLGEDQPAKATYSLTDVWGSSIYYKQAIIGEGQGKLVIQDVVIDPALSYIWKYDDRYGMRGSGFLNKAYATESWVVTPGINLARATNPQLSFDQARKYGDFLAQCFVMASTDYAGDVTTCTWDTIPFNKDENDEYIVPDGSNWNFISTGELDLSAYVGKEVYIGFQYTSDETNAATWEFQNILVAEPLE